MLGCSCQGSLSFCQPFTRNNRFTLLFEMLANLFALASSLVLLPAALAGVLVPRRDTPNFYLVATSSDPAAHLQSVKIQNYGISFTTGTPGKFFREGEFLRVDDGDPNSALKTIVNSFQTATGCATGGQLYYTPGSTNKCARYTPWTLSSYHLNSQLGAKIVFSNGGSFYSCSGGTTIFYSDTPLSDCTAVEMWTVPATA